MLLLLCYNNIINIIYDVTNIKVKIKKIRKKKYF